MSETTETSPSLDEGPEKNCEKSSFDEKESLSTDPLHHNPEQNITDLQLDKEYTLTDQKIEDEDPPTFYSVSSTTKNDESYEKLNIDQDTAPIKEDLNRRENSDKDDDSVCVVDSSSEGDDDEDDDEEDEDTDESDEEEDGCNSRKYRDIEDSEEYKEHISRGYRQNLEDEDNDDDDEYEEQNHRRHFRGQNDYEEDEDFDEEEEDDYDEDRFEPEHFEGNSDDCILRYNSNNGLNYQQKERSHSLQDISSIKGRNLKSKNLNPFSQKARLEKIENERSESIDKQYQDGDKTSTVNSADKVPLTNSKQDQESNDKNFKISDKPSERDSEIIKVCKSMKEYAEKTVKEVEIDVFEDDKEISIATHPMENGTKTNSSKNNNCVKESIRNSEKMEVELSDVEIYKNYEENDSKINGATVLLEIENANRISRKCLVKKDASSIILNGEEEKSYTTTRNLSYDEYMRGAAKFNESLSTSFCDTNYKSKDHEEKLYNQQLENVSLTNHSISNNYQEQEKLMSLTKHLNDVTIQLNQRNEENKNLHSDYKNLASQNAEMKNELENLRKMVIYYERQQESKKSVAAQTETVGNNLNESRVNSSTQCSNDIVADAVSTDASNAVNLDSKHEAAKTPKYKNFSQAFVTSSKILQTLSSITQRNKSYDIKKGKISNKTAGSDNLEIDDYELVQDSDRTNSKKRKATSFNLTELSKSAHPSKKYNMNYQDLKSKDSLEGDENTDDDKIKVFVYPEHGTGKDQSFLIQAKEIGENIRPGHRECGPFILGNIEVHMAEVNGTINIWGKEIVQETTTQYIEELDSTARSKLSKSSFYWQSTPQSKILNTNQASTISNKKSRAVFVDETELSHRDHFCKFKNPLYENYNPCSNHSCCTPKNQSSQENNHNCCTISPSRHGSFHGKCYHDNQINYNSGINVQSCCTNHSGTRRLSLPSLQHENQHDCCYNHCSSNENSRVFSHQKLVKQPFNLNNDASDDEVEITVSEQKHCQIKENLRSNNRISETFKACNAISKSPQPYELHINEDENKINSSKSVKGLLVDLLNNRPSVSRQAKVHQTYSRPSTSTQLATSSPYRVEEKCFAHTEKREKFRKEKELENQLEQVYKEMEKIKSRSDNLLDLITRLNEGKEI